MKQYKLSATITCPSNWTAADAGEYVKRSILTTAEEKASLHIDGAPAPKPKTPPEPTAEQCNGNARQVVESIWGQADAMACWYPQMGGHAAKALMVDMTSKPPGCFHVFVWHDGDFPFAAGEFDAWGDPRNPAELHHCEAAQFIQFGELAHNFIEGKKR